MSHIPLPNPSDLEPMLPGAATAVVLAYAASWIRIPAIRTLLVTLAAVAPWWITWAVTHDGGLPTEIQISSERGTWVLLGLALGTALLPARGGKAWLAAVPRLALPAAAAAYVLRPLLDPERDDSIDYGTIAVLGAIGLSLSAPLTAASERLRPTATLSAVSAVLGALGLAIVGISEVASISQVVASTSVAAGGLAALALVQGKHGIPATLPGAWMLAGFIALVDAHWFGENQIPQAALWLFLTAILVPALAGLASEERARSWRTTAIVIAISSALSGAALFAADALHEVPAEEEEPDPYADIYAQYR